MSEVTEISLKLRIDQVGEWATSLHLPPPVDQRLDDLVAAARDAAERTSRKELVAALIADATEDGTALSELIRKFRLRTVGEVTTAKRRASLGPNAEVIPITRSRPGIRSRKTR